MRVDVVLRYVGVVMLFIAAFMLLSAGISYVSGVDSAFYPLLLSSLLTALLGAFPLIFVERKVQITNKEGFCIVVGSWLVACVVGMFPYLIWGGEFNLENAWFESVSGFTTTGATILNDVEILPRGMQFWRMGTTWIGGMGVVMFALVVLPSMGRSKMTLSNVELSTLAKDNYRYHTQLIVQILLVVYVGLTALTTLLLKAAGMNWFDSLCHAMSACATSGFSTKNASLAYYNSPAMETILIFAMAIAGVHFGLIYATVTGKRNNIFRSEVARYYFGILLLGSVLIAVSLYAADIYPTLWRAFRYAAFQFVTLVTTTGFATADTNEWTSFAIILLIFGTFMEGTAIAVLLVPVLWPIAKSMGIDVIHFGMIVCISNVVGTMTPPVAVNIFSASTVSGLKMGDIAKAEMPFLIGYVAVFFVCVFSEAFCTFLIR